MKAKLFFYTLIIFVLIQCNEAQNPIKETAPQKKYLAKKKPLDSLQVHKNYTLLKENIFKEKKFYQQHNDIQRVKNVVFSLLKDSIFSYWYGTKWDYNGITQQPQKGSIACGYFVTTTLHDTGFKLERSYWGQKPASEIINHFCEKSSITSFKTLDELTQYLKKTPNKSILLLGLDSHIGYLYKENNEVYFIHSSYSGEQQVKKEKYTNSYPITSSKTWMIGNLLTNKQLLKNWLSNN